MRLALVCPALFALAACTQPSEWRVGLATFDARELGIAVEGEPHPLIAALPERALLSLPTYDGTGEVVHPDVLFSPGAEWPFLMAMTPYARTRGELENPSLLVSEDGLRFLEGPTDNPIVGPPPVDHNNDPDLVFDEERGVHRILYLETLRPETQHLIALESRDLVEWTSEKVLTYALAEEPFMVSPAVVREGQGARLYYVNSSVPGHAVEYLRSEDGRSFTKDATPVAVPFAEGFHPWHLDVFAAGSGWAMLVNGYFDDFQTQALYLATSPDLEHWELRQEPLIEPGVWRSKLIYRSTGVVSGDRLAVWFSFRTKRR